MAEFPIKLSGAARDLLSASILPELPEAPPEAKVSLVVRVKCESLVARDFAAFLELLDHVYGRSRPGDFRSYARKSGGHFRFSESRAGSWELIAEAAVSLVSGVSPLLILWLVLKYIPSTVNSLTSAYNQYQQAQLARMNRMRLRAEIDEDQKFSQLPQKQRSELARIADEAVRRERQLAPRVRRFVRASFLGVDIEISHRGKPRDDS